MFSFPYHPPSLLSNGFWGPCSQVKWLGYEVDHLPPRIAEVKNSLATSHSQQCCHGVVLI
jgi:hypothetical protein